MAAVAHEIIPTQSRVRRSSVFLSPEMWGAVAIGMMWLAVLFDGLFGSDITSYHSGTSSTTIPSVVGVAFFAFLGSAVVAKRAPLYGA